MEYPIRLKEFKNWCLNPERETLVMGILNVTPDSFSDGGKFLDVDKAVKHAESMIRDGADIIDVGGESTRPGATEVSLDEELQRVIPVIKKIRVANPGALISIDTTKGTVAKHAIDAGADIINDISGISKDPKISKIARAYKVPIIIMHIKGTPRSMQLKPNYKNLIQEIKDYFIERTNIAINQGIAKEDIILDPGIGFGRTVQNNFELIANLDEFCKLDFPIMIGPSRKSFIGTILDLPINERMEGTCASVTAGIMNGARIVRVHDVKSMKRIVIITEKIRTA